MPHPNNPDLSALRLTKPKELALKLRAALKVYKTVDRAAKELGISRRTFFRWYKELSPKEAQP